MKTSESQNRLELSPKELRETFSRNLRELTKPYRSISSLCRDLDINRTQFNRYLAGESFPRPEIIAQICSFFEVDARILLGPLAASADSGPGHTHPFLDGFVGPKPGCISEERFPPGFYRFSRQSFLHTDLVIHGLVYVFRSDGFTLLRGYASRSAMREVSLPTDSALREFRAVITPQEDDLYFMQSHRNNIASVFNYLTRVSDAPTQLWVGFAARPDREDATKRRITRLVFERLTGGLSDARAVAAMTGYQPLSDLPQSHQDNLRVDQPFV
ncbi:helix-turn-helix domain-containing protein [Shimia sp. MMG029]|uniref:helix-turn-helix domain-containing protein n=1 Tax=Shimia sp. MMG029 TaxID=3021978 RepID=UPI0022FED363|nr:helix-turn-helix transcriptional regulator [Shimia sp. MMG029]MDA5556331.1 helix-turn-helix transcriptional regulator [Shimia sp. MMG029]